LGGLVDIGRPQQFPVGAFTVSFASDLRCRLAARAWLAAWYWMRENPRGCPDLGQVRHHHD